MRGVGETRYAVLERHDTRCWRDTISGVGETRHVADDPKGVEAWCDFNILECGHPVLFVKQAERIELFAGFLSE